MSALALLLLLACHAPVDEATDDTLVETDDPVDTPDLPLGAA